tara:strand:+ start:238 stop:555 length:318 start_codon:yes stop_codon:yes gene_type:complete
MENEFKVGDKVKFKIGTHTSFGTISEVGKNSCFISNAPNDAWISNDCIEILQKKRVPVTKRKSKGIKALDIIGLMEKVSCKQLDNVDQLDIQELNDIYKEWKTTL